MVQWINAVVSKDRHFDDEVLFPVRVIQSTEPECFLEEEKIDVLVLIIYLIINTVEILLKSRQFMF